MIFIIKLWSISGKICNACTSLSQWEMRLQSSVITPAREVELSFTLFWSLIKVSFLSLVYFVINYTNITKAKVVWDWVKSKIQSFCCYSAGSRWRVLAWLESLYCCTAVLYCTVLYSSALQHFKMIKDWYLFAWLWPVSLVVSLHTLLRLSGLFWWPPACRPGPMRQKTFILNLNLARVWI